MQESDVYEEPRWHVAVALAVALILYVTLPNRVIVGPVWVLPLLTMAIALPLLIFRPRYHGETKLERMLALANVFLLNAFNLATIVMLFVWQLSAQKHAMSGAQLLLAAVQIWLTNVIVYALWYWEIDGGGPDPRAHAPVEERTTRGDFLFPQQVLAAPVQQKLDFRAHMWDYVFLSFNTATAFSPTDTFPLTSRAKILMMAESLTSLITIAVIAGRAVNILGG